MEAIINSKNKNKMQKYPQSKYNRIFEMSKSSNLTINSFINKKNDYSKDSTDMISREFLNSIKINPKSTDKIRTLIRGNNAKITVFDQGGVIGA